MNFKIIGIAATILSAVFYFVFGVGLWVLLALLLLTLAFRFNARSKNLGKLIEILFIFYLITYGIYSLGIFYPYSLIFVLTVLVMLIFYEGPEWSSLYFGGGQTAHYFRTALTFATASLVIFGAVIYWRFASLTNPVPVDWPLDVLILAGLGFSFYIAVVEEIIFRSFIFERAVSALGGLLAIVAQGVLYGLFFYRVGVPSGIEGLILGSLFGIGSGFLVYKSRSILLSLLARFILAIGIFVELTVLGRL